MALVKKLTKIGNSWGVILPAEVLKISGLEPTGECEIEVDRKGVLLRPHLKENKKDKKVIEAMSRFIKKYRNDLKKLA
jgi:putative addiction module antidote